MVKKTGFGKSVILYSVAGIFAQIINFLLLPVYTRYLGTSDYGILSVVVIFIGVYIQVIILGSDQAIGRLYFDDGKNFSFKKYLGTIVTFSLIWGIGLSILLTIFGVQFFGLIFPGVSFWKYLVFAVWGTTLGAFMLMYMVLVSAKEIHTRRAGITIFRSIFSIALILILLVGLGWGVFANVFGIFLADVIFGLFCLFALLRLSGFKFGINWKYLKASLAFSVPLMLFNLGAILRSITDRMLLTRMLSLDDVGLYSMGFNFGNILSIFITSWYITYKFRYMKLFSDNAKDKDLMVKRLNHVYLFVIGFIFLGLSAFTRYVLYFMTTFEFHEAYIVTPWIALTFLANGFGRMPTTQILFKKKTKYLIMIVLAGLVVNIIISIPLIYFYGYVGAAIGTFLSTLFTAIIYYHVSNRLHPYAIDRKFLIMTLALLVSWGVFSLFLDSMEPYLVGLKIVVFIFTMGILWLLLGKWEKEYFMDNLKKTLKKYLSMIKTTSGKD